MTHFALRIKKIIITKPITYKAETKILLAPGQYHPHDQAKWDSYKTNKEPKGISALMYLLSLPFTDGEPETQKLGHLPKLHSKSGAEPSLDVRFCLITLFAFPHCRLSCLDVRVRAETLLRRYPAFMAVQGPEETKISDIRHPADPPKAPQLCPTLWIQEKPYSFPLPQKVYFQNKEVIVKKLSHLPNLQ